VAIINEYTPELLKFKEKMDNAYELWLHAGSFKDEGHRVFFHFNPKYIRIMREHSALGFIDRVSGDVLYPKGYTGPTNRVRGNIFAPDGGQSAVAWHGVAMAEELS